MLVKRFFVVVFSLILLGCAIGRPVDWNAASKVRVGMPIGEVVSLMGPPFQQYVAGDGKEVYVWKYTGLVAMTHNYQIVVANGKVVDAPVLPGSISSNKIFNSDLLMNEGDIKQASKFLGNGKGKASGQVFLMTKGGEPRYASGGHVSLYPVCDYIQRYHKEYAKSVLNFPEHDSAWFKFVRSTEADAQGNFQFENLPNGQYYIESSVFWEVAGKSQGGIVRRMIIIDDSNLTIRVNLTGAHLI